MQSENYVLSSDIYDNSEWVRQIRKSAILFFGLSIILVIAAHYVWQRFDPKAFAEARAAIGNGRSDSLDFYIMHMFGPCLYFGWTTITKVLDKLLGSRGYQLPIAFVIIYYLFRAIASVFLGFVVFPILVVINLVKLLFARSLSKNRIVQFFS